MSEIEGIVDQEIETLGVEAALERGAEAGRPSWEAGVALSSTTLALVSALAALLASFAYDQTRDLQTAETIAATHQVGYLATAEVLRAREDLRETLGRPITAEDRAELTAAQQAVVRMRREMEEYRRAIEARNRYHDRIAVAVTLCQIAILMSGLSVMLRRRLVWIGGMGFAAAGTVLLVATALLR